MTKSTVVVSLADPSWRNCGVSTAQVRAAAQLTLVRGCAHSKNPGSAGRSLTILLASDDRLRELNLRFRGKDHPTNVLSFPAKRTDGYLGDVALALGVATREARTTGKRLGDHVLHLSVHGVLHLLGYDHEKSGEARAMERLEIAILHELGIVNPYTVRARAGQFDDNNV